MVLERPLYRTIRDLARRDHVSISQKARDLVQDALELLEDLGLDRMAQARRKTFDPKEAVSHAEMRKRLKL